MLLPRVRSVCSSILGERVSIPAGKYTLNMEEAPAYGFWKVVLPFTC